MPEASFDSAEEEPPSPLNSCWRRRRRWLLSNCLYQLPTSAALQEIIDQLRGRVIHLHVEGFNLVREVVEHHDGGDGDEQSDGRRHQRFRNTAGDCAETRGLLRRNLAERVQ